MIWFSMLECRLFMLSTLVLRSEFMGYQVNDAVLALAGALVVCKESLPDNDVIVQEKARFPRTCSKTVSTAFRFFV